MQDDSDAEPLSRLLAEIYSPPRQAITLFLHSFVYDHTQTGYLTVNSQGQAIQTRDLLHRIYEALRNSCQPS
jgi:hypothetical protein